MKSKELAKRVIDGDTIETPQGVIRLADVNAPELGQRWGKEAKQHLGQFVEGRVIGVHEVAHDEYGRRVAWVTCRRRSVNEVMNNYLAKLRG